MDWPVDPARYAAYLAVTVGMAFAPGPANLFSLANGAQRGRTAAVLGTVGMNLGTLCWFAAAALGLGALIAAFPQVFRALGWIGAAYVAWLGLQSLWAAWKGEAKVGAAIIRPGRSALRDGFTVQITNPKALLFFTAIIPPFMDAARPAIPQLALFAVGVITLDVVAMIAYGLGGAAITARMADPAFRRGFSLIVGLILLSAAALIALKA
ncbi:MAG TPA: LysE family translocator [Phenylobacterium sp.]|nr:LysE family translocator [Phenylobacterium sp.]